LAKRLDQTGDFCKGDEMSDFIQTLKTNFYGKMLMIFTVVFYFCMYASKTIHPLGLKKIKRLRILAFRTRSWRWRGLFLFSPDF
jgi:hypothetical protein